MVALMVTGGAGFIGSHLVDRLLAEGHEVVAVDDLSQGKLANLAGAQESSGFRFAQIDITSEGFSELIAETRPEVILHLAAQMDVRRSVADPLFDATVNVLGTVRLLEAARLAGTRKMVFTTSGGCIYGEPAASELPVSEDYPGHPHSPYGASKRGVEEYLYTYDALYGLAWTSLALANVFGPRQDPSGEAGVVSIFGGRMLRGDPVTIYGDGGQTRDFVYVHDVVDAFVQAIGKGDGLRCNIGTAEQTSVLELYREIASLTGYQAAPVLGDERSGELRHIAVSVARAKEVLGWSPVTGLRTGLAETVDWLRSAG